MGETFRLTLAQLNPVVGDIEANAARARRVFHDARAAGSDFIVLPEMFLIGYQAQDLVLRPAFQRDAAAALAQLARDTDGGPALGIGLPWREGDELFNAYAILSGGKVQAMVRKHELPNYGVFDERRYFAAGPISGPVAFEGGPRIGLPICEDAWFPDVAEAMAESGAEILVVPNGSPYSRGKYDVRVQRMVSRVTENDLPLVYLNMVGGQDDQVFDGGSFVLGHGGGLAAQLPFFTETVSHIDFTRCETGGWQPQRSTLAHVPDEHALDYQAMTTALRDYVRKSGFSRVLLGLSGGIDSALVAAIAVDALGAENVRGVMLPSRYTSDHSLEDAEVCARALGIKLDTVEIAGPVAAAEAALAPLFSGHDADLTEENIQSRMRGLLLMAQSNKFGEMLLTTGNKSEMCVGYATIYGDMNGGYNPIKDLYKTRVFAVAAWRNANHFDWMAGPAGEVIPTRIITKPPSAELRADQKDEDSLPPYPVLDAILDLMVDRDASVADCVAAGYNRETVKRVEHLVAISEYKRFQSAPGVKLSRRALWLDRRYPIVNRWRDKA
ncbi:NAD+ synthase [Ketogulonicigenium vulgare]|uniref:NAD+ synthase n=1 Tax=Ketogulonicigenium vulgare TaxID=92945 RepID=UPI00235864EC|nr:NAD+ synthase [Ketogulonicigenium vulgare]